MKSSPTPATELDLRTAQPLAKSAGVPYRPPATGSPIADWIDLMETVEALCLRWPEPDVEIGHDYRL